MKELESWASAETRALFEDAWTHSERVLQRCRAHLAARLPRFDLDPGTLCFVATGSVGRREALSASDLDLIVIVEGDSAYERLTERYAELRGGLSRALDGMDVSSGRTVMGLVKLDELVDPERIGLDKDDRIALTRRTLVLTEAAEAGGALGLRSIRRQILEAYIRRTGDAHPLALCNDVARYYRQLCIDYKAKHGENDFQWAESKVKLRHARKFWYYCTSLAIIAAHFKASSQPEKLTTGLIDAFDQPPCLRLLLAEPRGAASISAILDHYAAYLREMNSAELRARLRVLNHQRRKEDPDYLRLQENSRALHESMLALLWQVKPDVQRKVLDWFLL